MRRTVTALYDEKAIQPDELIMTKPDNGVPVVVEKIAEKGQTVAHVAGHLFGIIDIDGPDDLSTNRQHLDDFGYDRSS